MAGAAPPCRALQPGGQHGGARRAKSLEGAVVVVGAQRDVGGCEAVVCGGLQAQGGGCAAQYQRAGLVQRQGEGGVSVGIGVGVGRRGGCCCAAGRAACLGRWGAEGQWQAVHEQGEAARESGEGPLVVVGAAVGEGEGRGVPVPQGLEEDVAVHGARPALGEGAAQGERGVDESESKGGANGDKRRQKAWCDGRSRDGNYIGGSMGG